MLKRVQVGKYEVTISKRDLNLIRQKLIDIDAIEANATDEEVLAEAFGDLGFFHKMYGQVDLRERIEIRRIL